MKSRRRKSRFVVCASVVLLAAAISFSGVAAEATATAVIPLLQALSLSTVMIEFDTLAEADLDLGYKEVATAQQLTIKSNSDWVISIEGNSVAWAFTPSHGDPDPMKPAAELEWKSSSTDPKVTSTNASYTGLSLTASQVAAGDRGSSIVIDMDVRMLVGFADDPPGSYSIAVTYTVTAP